MKNSLFFLLLFIVSCSNNNPCDEAAIINFEDVNNNALNICIDPDKVHSVMLNTPSGIFIGTIKQIVDCDSGIIVVDKHINLFTKEGIFLRRISSYGKGPSEFLSIDKVRFRQGNIFILDGVKKTILEFLWSGNPVQEFRINSNPTDFEFVNDSIVSLYLGHFKTFYKGNYCLSFFNLKNQEHEKNSIKYDENLAGFMHFFDMSNFCIDHEADELLLSFSGSNIVYGIDNNLNISRRFIFNFGDNSLTNDVIDKKYNDVVDFCEKNRPKGVYFRFYKLVCCAKKIFLCTEQCGINKIGIADLSLSNGKLYSKLSINGGLSFNISFDNYISEFDNRNLIVMLNPVDILSNEAINNFVSNDLKIDLKSINPASNPLLIFIDINNF